MRTCNQCSLSDQSSRQVRVSLPATAELLFVLDYPTAADEESGIFMDGLDGRYSRMHKLLSDLAIDQSRVAFLPLVSCIVTRPQDIRPQHQHQCLQRQVRELDTSTIKVIVPFGETATKLVTGKSFGTIDVFRSTTLSSPYFTQPVVATYSLDVLVNKGCSGCNSNVKALLLKKDLTRLFQREDLCLTQ